MTYDFLSLGRVALVAIGRVGALATLAAFAYGLAQAASATTSIAGSPPFSSPDHDRSAAPESQVTLRGADAVRHLKQQGTFDSLSEALTVATYSIKPVARRSAEDRGDAYHALNAFQSVQTVFTNDTVLVSSNSAQKWQMGLKLRSYGYGDDQVSVVSGDMTAKHNRIEFSKHAVGSRQSAPLVEWYVNKPGGLEQGFTLAAAPPATFARSPGDPERLRLVMALTGDLQGETGANGQSIVLKDQLGRHVSTYDHLKAWDATGRELPARMQVRGGEVSLEVDDTDASYPVTIDPTLWQEQFHLRAADGEAGDVFGNAVAISGNTAVVGAFERSYREGAAYVFVRHGSRWTQQQKLAPTDGEPGIPFTFGGSFFGFSVAISGDTIIVGSPGSSIPNGTGGVSEEQGAAYVFVRSDGIWTQQQKLAAVGETPIPPGVYAFYANLFRFGWSVAISGNTAVIGSLARRAYVFARNGTTWSQEQKLIASDAIPDERYYHSFGAKVVTTDDTIVVTGGNLADPDGNTFIGTAYVYVRSGLAWIEQAKLNAADPFPGDNFGSSVAISGDTVIVGYYNTVSYDPGRITDLSRQGAYVFVRSQAGWSASQKLTPSALPLRSPSFPSVGISGDHAIIGLSGSDFTGFKGAAYVFARNAGTWTEVNKITARDSEPDDAYGASVAISGDTAIVGAPFDDVGVKRDQGSAYIFLRSPDTDGDGLPDDWEINGVTIDDVFIDLPAMGADPMHKDIFVHVDWMGPPIYAPLLVLKPDLRMIQAAIDSFARAPVEQLNPDHKPGINLHVDIGGDSVNFVRGVQTTWGSLSRAGEVPFQTTIGTTDAGGYHWDALDAVKAQWFNFAKRRAVFHYALFANNFSPIKNGGASRGLNGADFIITLGDWPEPGGTLLEQSGTFMHELGHNLGLDHGGSEDVNNKPNYLSIMNYTFQNIGLMKPSGKRFLDFSRTLLPPLNELSLSEPAGIGDPTYLTFWSTRTRMDVPPGSNKCLANANYSKLFLPSGALDWNCDGIQNPSPVTADINGDGNCVAAGANNVLDSIPGGDDFPIALVITAGPTRTCETLATGDDFQSATPGSMQPNLLTGFKDWPALKYDGGGTIGTLAGAPPLPMTTPNKEPSLWQLRDVVPEWVRQEELVAPLDVVTISIQTGPAPLTVMFDGSTSTAVTGSILEWAWNFDDGATGTGATIAHTFVTPGDYFVSLDVRDSSGRVNLVPLLSRIKVTDASEPLPPTPKPNLLPAQLAGWSDKIVVSNGIGTHADSDPLRASDSLFVDLAAINNGNAATVAFFSIKLYVDGVEAGNFNVNQTLIPGNFVYLEDVPIGMLAAGEHLIKVVTDANGQIVESDETDNEYTKLIVVLPPAPPTATLFKSLQTGDWSDPCTWYPKNPMTMQCVGQIPAADNRVEITHDVAGPGAAATLLLKGSITGNYTITVGLAAIEGGTVNAPLTVQQTTTITGGAVLNRTLTTNGITVGGALAGTGSIVLDGASLGNEVVFVNNGSVSVANVVFGKAFAGKLRGEYYYRIRGSGSWNVSGSVQLKESNLAVGAINILEIADDLTMSAQFLLIRNGAKLVLNGVLTFGSGTIANSSELAVGAGRLDFYGTDIFNGYQIDIGSSTLNFNGTGQFSSAGIIVGTGTVRFAPSDGNASFVPTYVGPNVLIASGVIDFPPIESRIDGTLTIAQGATLTLDGVVRNLTVNGDINVQGVLNDVKVIGGSSAGSVLAFNGSSFVNNGQAVVQFIIFNFSGAPRTQQISGTGAWGGIVQIGGSGAASPTTVRLMNDVTFNGIDYSVTVGAVPQTTSWNQFQVLTGGILDLNGHALTFAGGDSGHGAAVFSYAGVVSGAGMVRMLPSTGLSTINMLSIPGARFDSDLRIAAGTVTTNSLALQGFLTIDAGATLTLGTLNAYALFVHGSLTNNGTLNTSGAGFFFDGNTFTNNGAVAGAFAVFGSNVGAPSTPNLAGTGTWSGGLLYIDTNAVTMLLSDVTYAGAALWIDGRMNTGAFTLNVPCATPWSGTGDAVGNIRRSNMPACSTPVAFGNPLTTLQFTAGAAPTDVTMNIALAPPPDYPGAIKRGYTITPTSQGGYTSTLRLRYLDAELNGNAEATLQLWRRGATSWTAQGATTRNATANWVELAGVTQFSPWTLAGTTAPLPTPTIATNAAAGFVLGNGTLTDTATVSARVNPQAGATISFSLFGPDNATCTGAPAFTSTVAYPVAGGVVTSAAFTPTQPGTYRWVAAYNGDANNGPVTAACNAPNESTTVGAPATLLSASANPAIFKMNVTLTATIIGTTPTGTVNFLNAGVTIPGCTTKAVSGGLATCTTSSLALGNNALTVAYSGDFQNASSNSPILTVAVYSLFDVDANGLVDPLTDGLLILRHLFDITGPLLTTGAVGTGAQRTNAGAIASYIDGAGFLFDADGNGDIDALTDGLLIFRYMAGQRGAALIQGAVGSGATRTTSNDIENYVSGFLQ